mmetsp:Transcript_23231/g.39952  ORF Transcript_23231/g.39952 Transcript_23231/m.39952 type:complete len:251 (+) Transcript_23231:1057-1809(+)
MDSWVHDPAPDPGHHRGDCHHRIAIGQLRRVGLGIVLQDGKTAVRFVVVIGVPLQVDQQPVRRLVRRVPGMLRLYMLVFAVAQMFAGQAVVLDVIDQLKLPDRDTRLHQKQANPDPPAKGKGQQDKNQLQRPVFPERVGQVGNRQLFARQHCLFCAPGRVKALLEYAGVKPVETLAHAGGDRIAWRGDITVMHQQVLGPEMGIEDHGEQSIGQPAFEFVLLVHQLVAVVDPHRARDHADAKENSQLFERV